MNNHNRDFVPRTFKTTDEKRVKRLIRIAAYRGLDFVVNTIDLRNLDLGIHNLDINSEIFCGDDKCDYDYYNVLGKLDDSTYVYNLHADDFFLSSIMDYQKIMYKMQCKVDDIKPSIDGFYKYMLQAVGELFIPNINEINEYFAANYGGTYA